MREPTLIAATIGTVVAALRFQDEFRPDRYAPSKNFLIAVATSSGNSSCTANFACGTIVATTLGNPAKASISAHDLHVRQRLSQMGLRHIKTHV